MFNIAIDGFVGSGKSTLSTEIAKRLNLKVLDTGAIYRGIACYYIKLALPSPNNELINEFVKDLNVEIKFIENIQNVIVNGENFTNKLRYEQTSMMASLISPYQEVRNKVRLLQQKFASENDCIIEGRDIGTDVLPNAQVKLFLTGNATIRARRRFLQFKDKPNSPTYKEILEDLKLRDYRDTHREVAPLKPAEDAIIIDSTNMNLEEMINFCVEIIINKMKKSNISKN